MLVPEPLAPVFAEGKSAISVQEVPSQCSVFANAPGSLFPPNNKTAVLTGPALPVPVLAVFKSATSVHAVPFQTSVSPSGPLPPNFIPAVDVPAAP